MTVKTFHIVLAAAILFSTTGITLGKHLCKKELEVATLSEPSKCGQDGQPCDKDCCSHEFQYFQSDQHKLTQNLDLPTLLKPALVATMLLAFDFTPSFDNNTLHYLTYRPPIVHRDISVLLQTFLI